MTKQIHHIAKLLTLSLVISLGLVFAFPSTTNAATLEVEAPTNPVPDNTTDNNICSLSEAIENINDQAETNDDCSSVNADPYGTDDTITLPAATIELSADLNYITESVEITGQGMGQSIIDGTGLYSGLGSEAGNFVVSNLSITGLEEVGLFARNSNADFSNIEIDGDNWTVVDPINSLVPGIGVASLSSEDIFANINNIYVHGFDINSNQFFGVAILGGGDSGSIDYNVSNITVSDIANDNSAVGFLAGTGLFNGGAGTGTVSGTLNNATITNITSSANAAVGAALVGISQDTVTADLTLNNATITNLNSNGDSAFFGNGAGLAAVGAAGSDVSLNLQVSNLLIDTESDTCALADIGPLIGGLTGDVNASFTSQGGNLSDDSTCEDYFTDPTDQNNVSGLAASLDPLTDNGGFVPTMALKANSPAIDSGVTVASLTTDARGALRPQGNAYDSGAYESPFTRQDEEENQNADEETLAETGINTNLLILLGATAVFSGIFVSRLAREV